MRPSIALMQAMTARCRSNTKRFLVILQACPQPSRSAFRLNAAINCNEEGHDHKMPLEHKILLVILQACPQLLAGGSTRASLRSDHGLEGVREHDGSFFHALQASVVKRSLLVLFSASFVSSSASSVCLFVLVLEISLNTQPSTRGQTLLSAKT